MPTVRRTNPPGVHPPLGRYHHATVHPLGNGLKRLVMAGQVGIKPDGTLAYAGGIDDKPTTRPADIKDAKNFVDEALDELKAGKPVSTPATRAYGCTVKYSS